MMFYDQKLPFNTKSNLKVQLSDFSNGINTRITQNLLPLNYAVNCYNFDFNRRSLSTGIGIKEMAIPYSDAGSKFLETPESVDSILRFWQYTRYDPTTDSYIPLLMLYCNDEVLYFVRLETSLTNFNAIGVTFNEIPSGFNYRIDEGDCFFACSKNKIVKYTGNSLPTTYTENVPSITSVALHAGRLFATADGDQNVLWFSDDLNPTNWNISAFEGGYIELTGERGTCKKVLEANNYLYVIREYGISRISGWGLQEDFVVKNLYLTTGKLYYETAVLCGSVIIMLCSDGVYCFDGSSMNKLNLGFEDMLQNVDNQYAVGAYLDGKYYLACRLNYGDNENVGCESENFKNNTIIEIDINTWEINIARGIDVKYMAGIRTERFRKLGILLNSGGDTGKLYELTHDGSLFDGASHKFWQSPSTDMGYTNYKKVIKYITLFSISNITIYIFADSKKYEFTVIGSSKPVRVPINIICDKFSVAFSCDEKNCEISDPIIQVSLV